MAIRRPSWFKKIIASVPNVPRVSTAIGTKYYNANNSTFLSSSLLLRWQRPQAQSQRHSSDSVLTCRDMKSNTRHLPFIQGDNDRPSGRLPSSRVSDVGSRLEGISAEVNVRLIRIKVLDRTMTRQSTSRLTTAGSMSACCVNHSPTDTHVRCADRRTESKCHSNTQR